MLQSLSSVPAAVISDVRHHHERIDGRGYPDKLRGEEIPLGARIINVCDAIDAMLSDRPYRKALSTEATRDELKKFAGVQFDETVVEMIVNSTVLEEHVAAVRAPTSPEGEAEGDQSAAHAPAPPSPSRRPRRGVPPAGSGVPSPEGRA